MGAIVEIHVISSIQKCVTHSFKKECLHENCKFMHISGTRRTEHPNPPNVTNEYQNVSSEHPSRNSGRTTPNPRRATLNQSNRDLPTSTVPAETCFLDSIKALQEQKASLTGKIQQMEVNNAQWSHHQLQGYSMPPRYPLHPPIFPIIFECQFNCHNILTST